MATIRRIDTSIAEDILEQYKRNGYIYMPRGIVPYQPGWLIMCSHDNIDVLEEGIGGHNTFHCTQMVVGQCGPLPERCTEPV